MTLSPEANVSCTLKNLIQTIIVFIYIHLFSLQKGIKVVPGVPNKTKHTALFARWRFKHNTCLEDFFSPWALLFNLHKRFYRILITGTCSWNIWTQMVLKILPHNMMPDLSRRLPICFLWRMQLFLGFQDLGRFGRSSISWLCLSQSSACGGTSLDCAILN